MWLDTLVRGDVFVSIKGRSYTCVEPRCSQIKLEEVAEVVSLLVALPHALTARRQLADLRVRLGICEIATGVQQPVVSASLREGEVGARFAAPMRVDRGFGGDQLRGYRPLAWPPA